GGVVGALTQHAALPDLIDGRFFPLPVAACRDVFAPPLRIGRMSDDDSDDEGGLGDTIRAVTPLTKPHRNTEMDVIGWVIFLFLVVLALPLLPVIVVGW